MSDGTALDHHPGPTPGRGRGTGAAPMPVGAGRADCEAARAGGVRNQEPAARRIRAAETGCGSYTWMKRFPVGVEYCGAVPT